MKKIVSFPDENFLSLENHSMNQSRAAYHYGAQNIVTCSRIIYPAVHVSAIPNPHHQYHKQVKTTMAPKKPAAEKPASKKNAPPAAGSKKNAAPADAGAPGPPKNAKTASQDTTSGAKKSGKSAPDDPQNTPLTSKKQQKQQQQKKQNLSRQAKQDELDRMLNPECDSEDEGLSSSEEEAAAEGNPPPDPSAENTVVNDMTVEDVSSSADEVVVRGDVPPLSESVPASRPRRPFRRDNQQLPDEDDPDPTAKLAALEQEIQTLSAKSKLSNKDKRQLEKLQRKREDLHEEVAVALQSEAKNSNSASLQETACFPKALAKKARNFELEINPDARKKADYFSFPTAGGVELNV